MVSPADSRPIDAKNRTPDAVLRRLEWRVIRRLDGRMQGDYRTLLQGAGIDVADLREYEAGDDVRHIDWNVTARMDTPFVRTYLEDRELTAWLLLDRSASMGFGPADRPKELVLTEIAGTFARLMTRGGNRVGAILFNNAIEHVLPPRSGRNQALRLNKYLLTPPVPTGTTTKLADLVTAAVHTIKRRSLVIIVSDFISEPGWERPLSMLNQRHEVVAVRLFDPREHHLPDAGLIVVEDAETGELLSVDTSDPEFRKRYASAADIQFEEMHASAARARIDLHSISTEEDLVGALVRIVELRKQRRRG
jgi:uncharacterized protein (DUF58 family)